MIPTNGSVSASGAAAEHDGDEAVDRFEDAWQHGMRPSLDEFVPASGPGRTGLLADLANIDLEYRLKAGEPARVEDYLARHPDLANDEFVVALAATEQRHRRRREPGIGVEEYLRRFPQHRAALTRALGQGEANAPTTPEDERAVAATLPATLPCDPTTPNDAAIIARRPTVPGYEVFEELGRGGMGVVYRARQMGLNRTVALKVILSGPHAGPQELARFRAEAEAAARLQHPNVVQIFEVGESAGLPYFSLEHVEGGSLAQKLSGSPWPARRAAELVQTLARAIHAAHARGIIHRDLKPANVLLTVDGVPKVTDFGLAKRLDGPSDRTRTGALLGTPTHMAPEQAQGRIEEIGAATDVWALGAILYECLTGRPPFLGETPYDTVLQVIEAEPVPPSRLQPRVPRELENVCLKCLQKAPKKRYADAQELADDLQRFLQGEPVRARRSGTVERVVKWARRRPGVATLAALCIVLALGGVTGISWQWMRAEDTAALERKAKDEAKDAKTQAENALTAEKDAAARAEAARRQGRRNLYDAHMNLAMQAWRSGRPGDLARVRELLDIHRPEPGEEDLRGFEWFHLWRMVHSDELTLSRHKRWVRSLGYSPDGRFIVTGSFDTTVRVWEAATGHEMHVFKGHTERVHRVTFHPDGNRIASGSDDNSVRLWDLKKGEGQALYRHGGKVWAASFSPDGKVLASADVRGQVILYDLVAQERRAGHPERTDPANGLAFSPDGKYLAFACDHGVIHVWEELGKRDRRIEVGDRNAHVLSLAFAADKRTLALGCDDHVIRLWDVQEGKALGELRGHAGRIWGVAFNTAGDVLASAGWDGVVKLWDVAGRKEIETLRGHFDPVKSVAFSPADGHQLATASVDGTVKLWRLPVGQSPRPALTAGPVGLVAASANGESLLTTSADLSARPQLWAAVGARPIALAPAAQEALTSATAIAHSPDGKIAAAGNQEGALSLWEVTSGKQRASLDQAHASRIDVVAFSTQGNLLATASAGESAVRVWAIAEDKVREHGRGPLAVALCVRAVFSQDGNTLATVSSSWLPEPQRHGRTVAALGGGKTTSDAPADDTVRLWDLATGQMRLERTVRGRVRTVAFAPGGKALAVAGSDKDGDHEFGTVHLWEIVTGKDVRDPLTGHAGRVESLVFSRDGRALAAGDKDGQVKLWDIVTGQEKVAFFPGTGPVVSLAFTADGTALSAISDGQPIGAVHSWLAATDADVLRHAERRAAADADDRPAQTNLVRACWGAALALPSSEAAQRWRLLEKSRANLQGLSESCALTRQEEQWLRSLDREFDGKELK